MNQITSGVIRAVVVSCVIVGCAGPTSTMPASPPPTPQTTATPSQRPNIVVIITDDQRYDSMDFMPQTRSVIFDRGVTFSKAYVTTPLCCPSRSSILTGQYAHSHGVLNNETLLQRETFVDRLHAAGYFTGLIGKYLNSWNGEMRPEFDYWVGAPTHKYFNPRLNINGTWQDFQGYQTTILGQFVDKFLDKAIGQSEPWLLYYAPHAPHPPSFPAPEYQNLYSDLAPFRPPSFNEADMSDKAYQDSLPLLTDSQIAVNDDFRLRQLRALKSVDDTVSAIIKKLDAKGLSDNTAIFFISDNGILLGEHRLSRIKNYYFEPSIHVPFAFSYPPLTTSPKVIDKLVANIDLAPTIYQLAGLTNPPEVEGMSLLPLIAGLGAWRDQLLIENWTSGDDEVDAASTSIGRSALNPYIALHRDHFIYVEVVGGPPEFYDLQNDPDELQNQVTNPDYAAVINDMKTALDSLKGPFATALATQAALPAPTSTPDPTP